MAYLKTTNIFGTLKIHALTQSVNSSTGALIVGGGVGIKKDLFLDGNATIGGTLSLTGRLNGLKVVNVSNKELDLSVASLKVGTGTGTGKITISSNNSTDKSLTLGQSFILTGDGARTLTLNNANKTISGNGTAIAMAGNLTFGGAFTTSGAHTTILRTTGNTDLTLPTTGTLITKDGPETLTSKTLTNPKMSSGTSINDANGNELIKFPTAVGSAVNEITISNVASGGRPSIKASGNDTNVSLEIGGKGSGVIYSTSDINFSKASDRFLNVEQTDANVAGKSLTISAGSSGTRTTTGTLPGGNLILSSGQNVGNTTSKISFKVASGTATGTILNSLSEIAYINKDGFIPFTSNKYNLGSSTLKWKDAYFSGDTYISGDTHISGDLIVDGENITLNTTKVEVEDNNIELGAIESPTDEDADGGGITLKSNNTDKTIKWINLTDSWTFNQGIDITTGGLKIKGADVINSSGQWTGGIAGDLVGDVGSVTGTITNVKSGATIGTVDAGATITTISTGARFTNHTGDIGTNNGAISTNNGAINTNTGTITTTSGNIGTISGGTIGTISGDVDFTTHTGTIDSNTGSINNSSGAIGTNTGAITNSSGNITNVNSEATISNVNSGATITTVKSGATIGTVDADATITNISTGVRFTNHTGDIGTNTGAISTNTGTITTSSGNIGTISGGTIGTISGDVDFTTHTGTITTNNGAITTNNGAITNVNSGATITAVKSGATITTVESGATISTIEAGVNVNTIANATTVTNCTNLINFPTNSINFTTNGSITTTSTGTLTLDSGTTGAVNIGTGASAKTITIGSTSSSAIKLAKLNTNGFVKTSNANGTLYVDNTSYLPLGGGTLSGTLTSRAITPSANNTYDIGTTTVKYKNGYFAGTLSASQVYGAVWNDIADFLDLDEEIEIEYGKVYFRSQDNKVTKTAKRGNIFIGIASDTFGFGIGRKENKPQLPIAIGGWVLAHTDKVYPAGTPLIAGADGVLIKPKLFEKILFPERIVATFDREEKEEFWNEKEVKGRHWVKVK
jgi:hypothetical protein